MTDLIETMARVVYDRWRTMNNFPLAWPDLDDDDREAWRKEMRENFDAIEAAGHRVVPVEPTEEMHAAGVSATGNHCLTNEVRCAYAAMLAAAPTVTE